MEVTTVDAENFQKFQCASMSRKRLLDGKNEREECKIKGDN